MERVLSPPFFSERFRDGSLTENMAEKLRGQSAGYDDGGAALTCDERRFRSFWGEAYELGHHANWRRPSWQTKKTATYTAL